MSDVALLILIVVLLAIVGAWPTWPHATNWGPAPVGVLGLILVLVIVLVVLGRL